MYTIFSPQQISDERFTSVSRELLVKCLTVYEGDNLIRCCDPDKKNGDGGYIISDISGYDLLVSGGIDDDITFEKIITKKYNVNCIAFDGESKDKASKVCEGEEMITHIPKNIGCINTDNVTNLQSYINRFNNIFLKLDIEGAEFEFIDSLSYDHLKRIKQIVLEFHFVDIINKWRILEKISETHYLIHFHANNNNKVIYSYNYFDVPAVFECTYVRKSEFKNVPELNKKVLPLDIDKQNVGKRFDYRFDCPPWVNK